MIRFLLGVVVGIVSTVYFFQSGGSDYLVSSSTKVRHLEEQLQHADQQQANLAKKLEEATTIIEKMTTQFTALEQRFQTLAPPENPKTETPPVVEAPLAPPAPESGSAPKSLPEDSGASNLSDPPAPM